MSYSTGIAVGIATGTMMNRQIISGGGGSSRDPDNDDKYIMKGFSRDFFVGAIGAGVIGIGFGAFTLLAASPVGRKRTVKTLSRQVSTVTARSEFREDMTDFLFGATLFSFGTAGLLGTTSLFCWTCYKIDKFLSKKPKVKNSKDTSDKY
ncbi:Hypothetical protein PACV_147 [Pacmanvirus A23]|uniref:Hypothetical protein n=1 Tax=Pacmanvirus A23 TaxID=1932881 RepID=UPI000A09354A|nr:Hypothetical protein B9W72_gp145 [Pacmanvirus A23]SIP85862.1 Hypothetical protein PACV_147 [Pacmanvirus A23]